MHTQRDVVVVDPSVFPSAGLSSRLPDLYPGHKYKYKYP